MRQKKPSFRIGEAQISSISKHPHSQFQENPSSNSYKSRNPHLPIQTPSSFNEQPHSNSKKKPHKTQLPNPQRGPLVMSPKEKVRKITLTFCSSSEALLATKAIALKLFKFSNLKLFWIKAPLRLLILLLLPSLYFFSLTHHTYLYLYILFVIIFSSLLLCYQASNLSSIPLLLARNLSILRLCNTNNPPKSHPEVVWSIGSRNQLEEGSISGFSVKIYSNGDVYEGEFYKGKCSGSGVYYYHMNGRYEGDWIDQKYDGYGVETWAKGSRYRGQYRQGARHGYGVYRFYTVDMYAGEWFMGQCHGCGVHTCEDGSKYVGQFKGGLKHGLGHYHFRNGDTYTGEYFADKMHGFGVYHFANGHRYEGAWHEGRRQGLGMYTFRNGETQSGHWENGVLSVSTTRDGSSPGFDSSMWVSHAKVLKAVQDARCIAEKAVTVAEVEARVNRAVAAANRAANAARVAAVKAVQNRLHCHVDADDLRLPIV